MTYRFTQKQVTQVEAALALSLGYFPPTVDGGAALERAQQALGILREVTTSTTKDPVAILHVKKLKFQDVHINNHEWIEWLQPKVDGMKLYSEPVEPFTLTHRELDLLDGMIESQLYHSERCGKIDNRPMAEKQIGWNNERIELLRRIRNSSTIFKE